MIAATIPTTSLAGIEPVAEPAARELHVDARDRVSGLRERP